MFLGGEGLGVLVRVGIGGLNVLNVNNAFLHFVSGRWVNLTKLLTCNKVQK